MLTHKGTQTLTTQRLTLRRIDVSDTKAMFENWATDAETAKFLSWDVHATTGETRAVIEKWVAGYENPEQYLWVIEFEGTVIGTINLHDISTYKMRVELGYCMGRKWWNRGIMTEAARAVADYAFRELNANRILALHDTENPGSGRVMQNIGMILEGTLRRHSRRKDGSFGDINVYGILREEWQEKRAADGELITDPVQTRFHV